MVYVQITHCNVNLMLYVLHSILQSTCNNKGRLCHSSCHSGPLDMGILLSFSIYWQYCIVAIFIYIKMYCIRFPDTMASV